MKLCWHQYKTVWTCRMSRFYVPGNRWFSGRG